MVRIRIVRGSIAYEVQVRYCRDSKCYVGQSLRNAQMVEGDIPHSYAGYGPFLTDIVNLG